MQPTLHRTPKIKKALSRAIGHELNRPGELTDFLTYSAIMGAWGSVEKQEYLARRAALKTHKITKRYAR
jgi:hypothetical protein